MTAGDLIPPGWLRGQPLRLSMHAEGRILVERDPIVAVREPGFVQEFSLDTMNDAINFIRWWFGDNSVEKRVPYFFCSDIIEVITEETI